MTTDILSLAKMLKKPMATFAVRSEAADALVEADRRIKELELEISGLRRSYWTERKMSREIAKIMSSAPILRPAGECSTCGFPRSEHHHDGACYGICGEFS